MTKEEQLEFIDNFLDQMKSFLKANIAKNKLENWDGIELRQYCSDSFKEQTYEMDRKRKRDYQNTVIINDM